MLFILNLAKEKAISTPILKLITEMQKANGLKIGFYHYVTAKIHFTSSRASQFFFAKVIAGKEIDCRLAMDFESFGNLSISEINVKFQKYF